MRLMTIVSTPEVMVRSHLLQSRRRQSKRTTGITVSVSFCFSSRRRHTRFDCDWSSDVCSSDLIYADESLWRAKIHPSQLGAKLTCRQAETLWRALQEILRKAIVLRGSSISDFLDAEGQPGEYQRRHRAYGREGKNCQRCKTAIRRGIVAGRSSYFCPSCQRAPRGFTVLPLPRRTARVRSPKPRRAS